MTVQAWVPESRMSECLLLIAITPEPDSKGGSVSATTEAFSGKCRSQSSHRLTSISLGYMGPWGWWKPVYFPQKTQEQDYCLGQNVGEALEVSWAAVRIWFQDLGLELRDRVSATMRLHGQCLCPEGRAGTAAEPVVEARLSVGGLQWGMTLQEHLRTWRS